MTSLTIRKFGLVLAVMLTFTSMVVAQLSAKKLLREATKYYEADDFHNALEYYLNYHEQKPDNNDVKLKIGISYFEINKLDLSLQYLNFLLDNVKNPSPELYLYLGKVYHHKFEFTNAIKAYKLYLRSSDSDDREAIKASIMRCASGLTTRYQDEVAIVENLGFGVNTVNDEFAPIQSPNFSDKIYFSSIRAGNIGGKRDEKGRENEDKGYYTSDIFSSSLQSDGWSRPEPMTALINGPRHNKVLDFTNDGKVMFFFKGYSLHSGEILVDTFKSIEERALFQDIFNGPINASQGDSDPFFFNDSILVFASRRDGGMGGSDLYVAVQNTEGDWSKAINLGPTINTPYDEKAPMLALDGRTLYFSSNNLNSLGGFDIFKSKFKDSDKSWSQAINLGLPINSAGDESSFRLDKEGIKAFFSSSRKESFGKRDIYVAFFKSYQSEVVSRSNPPSFFQLLEKDRSDLFIADNSEDIKTPDQPDYNDRDLLLATKPDYIESLLIDKNKDLLSKSNKKKLNKIIEIMGLYPTVTLQLHGHSDGNDPEKFDHYFTIKKTEEVRDYLILNGISTNRIQLLSSGRNYPIASKDAASGNPESIDRLNRRIDIQFFIETQKVSKYRNKTPFVNAKIASNKAKFFESASKNLSYRIQVASVSNMFDNDILVNYPDPMIEKSPNNRSYQYTVGLYKSYTSALQLKRELEKIGISDSKIIPYINGLRINRSEATNFADQYRDLAYYLIDNN